MRDNDTKLLAEAYEQVSVENLVDVLGGAENIKPGVLTIDKDADGTFISVYESHPQFKNLVQLLTKGRTPPREPTTKPIAPQEPSGITTGEPGSGRGGVSWGRMALSHW